MMEAKGLESGRGSIFFVLMVLWAFCFCVGVEAGRNEMTKSSS